MARLTSTLGVTAEIDIDDVLSLFTDAELRAEMEERATNRTRGAAPGKGARTVLEVDARIDVDDALRELSDSDLTNEFIARDLSLDEDESAEREEIARELRAAITRGDRQHIAVLLRRLAPEAVL